MLMMHQQEVVFGMHSRAPDCGTQDCTGMQQGGQVEVMQLQWAAGNRLWEWYSVGRYGTAGYDIKAQKFVGEEWPEVGPPPDVPQRHTYSVIHISCTSWETLSPPGKHRLPSTFCTPS